jgi:uncharacterized membrane protein YjfL (UPF0719 family)
MNIFDVVFWDGDYMVILLTKMLIAVVLFASLRFFSGAISNSNATSQLTEKDNPAYGISLAGVVLAVTIMLSGTIYDNPETTLEEIALSTVLYGALGIVLMSLSRLIFDDIALPKISLKEHILKGNIAAGLVDAGNVIATAIIIRAVMLWVEYNTIEGIKAVLIGYLVSQAMLTLVTHTRVRLFPRKVADKSTSLQDELAKGNVAVALRFTGRRIGSALAISAASSTLLYELSSFTNLILAWTVMSFLALVILHILSFIADRIILANIAIEDEVIRQKNAALGATQGAIYLSLGLLLAQLMG